MLFCFYLTSAALPRGRCMGCCQRSSPHAPSALLALPAALGLEHQAAASCLASPQPLCLSPRSQNSSFSPSVPHGFHPDSFQQPPSWLLCIWQRHCAPFCWPATLQTSPCSGSGNTAGSGSPWSPNPGERGQSCWSSRAAGTLEQPAVCPAVARSFDAALRCLQAFAVFGWGSYMRLVSHCHIDPASRFGVWTAIWAGGIGKAV